LGYITQQVVVSDECSAQGRHIYIAGTSPYLTQSLHLQALREMAYDGHLRSKQHGALDYEHFADNFSCPAGQLLPLFQDSCQIIFHFCHVSFKGKLLPHNESAGYNLDTWFCLSTQNEEWHRPLKPCLSRAWVIPHLLPALPTHDMESQHMSPCPTALRSQGQRTIVAGMLHTGTPHGRTVLPTGDVRCQATNQKLQPIPTTRATRCA
jgi:hypothetical protein